MFLLLAMAMVETDLKEMATMATMLAKTTSSIWRFGRVDFLRTTLRVVVVVSESLVTRKHVGVALARVVH